MLALLANCMGHFGAMSSVFSRFWTRTAKRRQKEQNGHGACGSQEEMDDSEFVRFEGRAKAVVERGQQQQLCWTESEGSSTGTGQQPQSQQQLTTAPVIRIETSESPDGTRRGEMGEGGGMRGKEEEDEKKEEEEANGGGGTRGRRQSLKAGGQQRERQIGGGGRGGVEKDSSFSSVDLSNHRGGRAGLAHQHRPSSSVHGEADLQMCLGKPCARLRLSVQYGEQKKLLILTLHELAQTEDLGMLEGQQPGDERMAAALQVRLALLADGQQPSKVQKFQSKFQPLDQLQVHYGETFAFSCAKDQLAGSVVRLRLYRKSRQQRRPQCLGVAFLRNYLVDVQARKAQNHFLQFRRSLIEPKSAKGSMSLFPSSLLSSLTHPSSPSSSSHRHPNNSPQQNPPPKSPPSAAASAHQSTTLVALATPHHHHQQQQQSACSSTPQSASSSRRGSTVDDSGRFCSLPQLGSNQPEVLVSLCYFDVQNRLMVGVDKAAAIGTLGRKEEGHEVFLRITALSPDGVERGKQKSECVRANGAGETQFNVQAYFDIPRNELAHSSVQLHLFALRGTWPLRRKSRIGSLTLSQLDDHPHHHQSADAQTHWREMIQGMGITVDKWHILQTTVAEHHHHQQQQKQQADAMAGGTGEATTHFEEK